MGKGSRWFKWLLGMKKDKENINNLDKKEKNGWSIGKPMKEPPSPSPPPMTADTNAIWSRSYMSATEKEQNKHAIAVAEASTVAANAAVAAAQAAVEVVRLTSLGRGTVYNCDGERWAAVKIQAVFRAYLARKALRALRGLVKFQALVRGFLVRKRAVATFYSMQALFRAQTTMRFHQRGRRHPFKDCQVQPDTRRQKSAKRFEHKTRSEFHSKRVSTFNESTSNTYEESPKKVEIDMYRPNVSSGRIHTGTSDYSEESHHQYHNISSPLPCKIPTRMPITCGNFQDPEWGFIGEEYKYSNTTQNTPRLPKSYGSNMLPIPARSICGDDIFSSYSNHPSHMANTESFTAKQRPHSNPKQRPEIGTKRERSLIEIMASRSSLSGLRMRRSCSKAQEAMNL